jgi:hypothetical protein
MIAWLKRHRRKEQALGPPPRLNAPSTPLLIR